MSIEKNTKANASANVWNGPLMIDIAGTELTALDRERLCHPLVGGVILFSRNYVSVEQLTQLCADIHVLRTPCLLIAVDHEGGRVQRFREGFTRLPAPGLLGELWQTEPEKACQYATAIAYVLAAELRACGVDFSFTPVLDLNYGRSTVIGNRSLHRDPQVVTILARAVLEGLRVAGMAACGKHFPGHGFVTADSHVALPVDERSLAELAEDMQPYRDLRLDAIMPAHVIYPKIDHRPAGFSPVWFDILRTELGFSGVVFSDDLSMEGASVAGGILERANAAWGAGCDMLLVCNAPDTVAILLEKWVAQADCVRAQRVAALMPTQMPMLRAALMTDTRYLAGVEAIQILDARSA